MVCRDHADEQLQEDEVEVHGMLQACHSLKFLKQSCPHKPRAQRPVKVELPLCRLVSLSQR